ncbi:hypothetical protein DY000_02062961 [Brassica cretica]|uniref:Uncharacterized protein n=1 Tax=Brassica cretica TaxID=69181 RepID=A0ABQ7APY2_BRACR|nr:hypothetical protein DY000_02062961 [Brassica cretica]
MALDSDIMTLIGNSAQDSFPLPFPNEEQETNGFVRRGFTHILSLTRDPIALTVYHEQLSSLGNIEMVKSDSTNHVLVVQWLNSTWEVMGSSAAGR